jgi:hypothetical protein
METGNRLLNSYKIARSDAPQLRRELLSLDWLSKIFAQVNDQLFAIILDHHWK